MGMLAMIVGVMAMAPAMAKRGAAPVVESVEVHGLYFTVHPVYTKEGMTLELVARRTKVGVTNEPLTQGDDIVERKEIYKKTWDMTLERDVQYMFAETVVRDGGAIKVVLENGKAIKLPVSSFLQPDAAR